MTTWFLPLILMFSMSAHAKGGCEFFVGESPIQESLRKFKQLGFTHLIAEYEQGKIEVSRRMRLTPWQPAVSARVSITGNKTLVLRHTSLKTETEKQKFVWQLAVALFDLKMRGNFFNEIHNPEEITTADFVAGFQLPKAWRDTKLNNAQDTLKELYYLFMLLDRLDASVILPKRDLRKYKPVLVPNQEDFDRLVNEGEAKLEQAISQRHKRSFLFAYYFNHLRRMLLVTGTVMALQPVVQEMPGLIEASDSFTDFLLNAQMELLYQSTLGAAHLQGSLQVLYDKYPWLAYLLP